MSSSAGLASYSSLFTSGLDPTGRVPPLATRQAYGYAFHPSPNNLKDFPSNINARRPSADTDSYASRRSSLPVFPTSPSDLRSHAGSSTSPTSSRSPAGISFTPSVLLRSDTTTTKRSNLKSFLSLDANDTVLQSSIPPLPTSAKTSRPSPSDSLNTHKHARAVSANSSTWAPALTQHNAQRNIIRVTSDPSNLVPGDIQGPRYSISQSLHEETRHHPHQRYRSRDTLSLRTFQSQEQAPRIDSLLEPLRTASSFLTSVHDLDSHAEYASGISATQTIPDRPTYEPRVRSSLPDLATLVSPPASIPRHLHRNMSIATVSTFKSLTPSQRSAIKRARRGEALARLEGSHYDPAPHIQAKGSFMPFESDEEEDENEEEESQRSPAPVNKFISESVGQRSPPPIKPPSPLRYRSPEQRRFLEDKPELKPISPLEPIDETPFGPSPRRSRNWSQVTNQAPAVARSTAMPTLNQEDDEDVDDTDPFFPTTPQPKVHALPRAGLGPSPLSSRTNLTIHSTSHSNSSLASFTPISTSEISRARNAPVMNKAGTLTPNHLQSPEGLKQSSGPASIYSTRSASIRSNDDASVESFDSAEYGPSPRQRELVRRNDSKSPPSASRSKQIPAMNAPAPSWPPHPLPLAEPTKQSSSKSRSAKDSKRNQDKFEYETWLDLSGDEKKSKHSANRDGSSKKRLWPFGK